MSKRRESKVLLKLASTQDVIDMTEFKEFVEEFIKDEDDVVFKSRLYSLLQNSNTGELSRKSYVQALSELKIDDAGNPEDVFANMVKFVRADNPASQVSKMIEEVDVDQNGEVCLYELPQLLENLNIELSPVEIYQVFKSLDEDESGEISVEELETFLWDCWVLNRSVLGKTELVTLAFHTRMEEIRNTMKEKKENTTDVTAEDAPVFFEYFEQKCKDNPNSEEVQNLGHFLRPLDADWLVKACELFDLEKEEEENWAEDLCDELEGEVESVVAEVDKLLLAFSRGNQKKEEETKFLTLVGIQRCVKFFQIENVDPAECFKTFDTDNSETVDIMELTIPVLRAAKGCQSLEVSKILQSLLSSTKDKLSRLCYHRETEI